MTKYKCPTCGAVKSPLTAAAPELLEELKRLREWMRRPWGADDGPENDVLIDGVDAIIAKAEGGA